MRFSKRYLLYARVRWTGPHRPAFVAKKKSQPPPVKRLCHNGLFQHILDPEGNSDSIFSTCYEKVTHSIYRFFELRHSLRDLALITPPEGCFEWAMGVSPPASGSERPEAKGHISKNTPQDMAAAQRTGFSKLE